MRIVVFGAGAVGSLLGARLSAAGHDVLLVARPPHARAISAKGLYVRGRTVGRFRLRSVVRLPAATRADAVLLTVKSRSLRRAARTVARRLASPAPVLVVQNGLGVEPAAVAGLRAGGWRHPERWLIRGINTVGVTLVAPGRVTHAGEGEIVLPADPRPARAGALRLLERLIADAGIPHRRARGFPREVWRKVLVNAAVNPVTAAHGVVNGALLRAPLAGPARALLREAQRVAGAEGYPFSDEEADRDLARVLRATARNRSSMLQDLDRGRPTEIGSISGALLRLGTLHGLDLPATRAAVARLRERERAARRSRRRPDRSPAQRSYRPAAPARR